MSNAFDRDSLATLLAAKMNTEKLSIRAAAAQIGCGAATLSRMLQGSESKTYPEGKNLIRAASWVDRSLFELSGPTGESTIGDVELHLRAIPDLPEDAASGLIAMVRAVYDKSRLVDQD